MNDTELLQKFEDCTLPFDQWTHRAHVRVAYCYLSSHPFAEALDRVRTGIKKYNAANRVPEGPMSGYNETTTVAFVRIIDAVRQAYASAMPTADSEEFCEKHPQLLHRQVLRLFYSLERWMHPDAKTQFVEPDLAALPKLAPLR